MTMTEAEEKRMFAMPMGVLTELVQNDYPHFQLSKETMRLYFEALRPLGIPRVVQALTKLIEDRDSGARFPSIKEIKQILQPEVDPQSEAVFLAGKVIEAVAKDGYNNIERAKQRVGEKAWQAVQGYGGWESLCSQLTEKNGAQVRAQLRDLILAGTKHKAVEGGGLAKLGFQDLMKSLPGTSSTPAPEDSGK